MLPSPLDCSIVSERRKTHYRSQTSAPLRVPGVGVWVAKGVKGIGVGARVGEVIQLLLLYGTPKDCDETNVPLGKVLAIQKRDQGYCTYHKPQNQQKKPFFRGSGRSHG